VRQAARVDGVDAGPPAPAPVGGVERVGGGEGLGQGGGLDDDVAAVLRAADEDGREGDGAGDAGMLQTSAGWSLRVAMAVLGDVGGIALCTAAAPRAGLALAVAGCAETRRPKPHPAAGWYAAAAKTVALKKAST
jgi:hypothetical protein